MSWVKIKVRWAGLCDVCGKKVEADSEAMFENGDRVVAHEECYDAQLSKMCSPIQPVQDGVIARYNPPPKKD